MNTKTYKPHDEQTKIRKYIISLLIKHYGFIPDKLPADSLFMLYSNFDACDLVYLLHLIESDYNILFTEAEFDDKSICTISGLTNMIYHKKSCVSFKD